MSTEIELPVFKSNLSQFYMIRAPASAEIVRMKANFADGFTAGGKSPWISWMLCLDVIKRWTSPAFPSARYIWLLFVSFKVPAAVVNSCFCSLECLVLCPANQKIRTGIQPSPCVSDTGGTCGIVDMTK